MSTVRVVFDEVKATRTRTGRCPVCGKSVRRSRTFDMTVSPFNRNPDGTVRTAAEVREAVEAKADRWVPDFTHDGCAS